jgi:Tol biopolymer transport system component
MFRKRLVLLPALLVGLGAALLGLLWAAQLSQPSSTPPPPPAVSIANLSQDPGNAVRPAWSPDNRLIAYESNRYGPFHIYVMDADGSHQHALTTGPNDDRHPIWTRDGRAILYDSSNGTRQDIWMVNVADGSRKQLTQVDGLADYPSPSPDGTLIAFYLYKDMTLNIWSARADGTEAKPLTRDLADARREQPTISWYEPSWSPDSQWLAYAGGEGRSIWMMRRDGTDARLVVDDGEDNHFPRFLSNEQLAFITEYVPPRYDKAWTSAWVYDLQTGQRTLMQDHMCMQGPVDWSIDNSKILFHSPRDGNFDIYLIDLNAPGGLTALHGTSQTDARNGSQ